MKRSEILETIGEIVAASEFGPFAMTIRGGCMEPRLRDGARVTLERPSGYLPGDIIVFRSATDLVAHRLLGWASDGGALGFVTKGDHCARHDGVVAADRVLGRVVADVGLGDRLRATSGFVAIVLQRLVGRR